MPQRPRLALADISRMCLKMLLCSLVDNLVISVEEISINNSYKFIFHLTERTTVRKVRLSPAEVLCWSVELYLYGTAPRFWNTYFIFAYLGRVHILLQPFLRLKFSMAGSKRVLSSAYFRSWELSAIRCFLPPCF